VTTTPPPSRRGPVPAHVAWVARRARGRPEEPGREERALVALVETALDLGVAWLTVQDPSGGRALRERTAELARRGVALAGGSGAPAVGAARPGDFAHPEEPALRVFLAEEGSGRRELVGAVRELAARGVLDKEVSEASISGVLAVPDVDLLVLTGDDRRVPDLLIWQVAYSEIVVLPDPWPEAAEAQFHAAIGEYRRRDRRYGGLVASR
jgi:undecaprenyl diphosphate synthase